MFSVIYTMSLDFLEIHGVIEMILYLLSHPEGKQKVDIRLDTRLTTNASVKSFNILFEKGLLKQIKSKKSPNKDLYTLSTHGIEIAKLLEKIRISVDIFSEIQSQKENWFEFEFVD